MIDARSHVLARTHAIAVLLGIYATAVALAPAAVKLFLIAPLLAVPLGLWALAKPERWCVAFLCCALVLPPLPIPMGDSGPHVCAGMAALGAFVGVLRMREWRLRVEPAHLAMLAYCCVLAASVAFAMIYSGPAIAAGSLARVILFSISIYVFFYTACGPGSDDMNGGVRSLRIVYWAGVASALFACVDFYFQFPAPAGFGPQFVWLESGVYRRAQGVFYEASTLGNLSAFFLVMIAAALADVGSRKGGAALSRPALFAGTIVFVPALMLSFSRASLIALFASIVTLLYLKRRRIGLRRLVVLPSIALSAVALGCYFLLPRFTAFYWDRITASVAYFFQAADGILSGRLESWGILGRFLLEHPWHAVFGLGYKTLPYTDVVGRPVIADNAYLSALVETGIVGLAAMLLFNCAVLRIAYRAMRHPASQSAFFGACVFCFWIGEMLQMLSGDLLTYWRVLPVYLWVLGLAARRSIDEPSSARSIQ